MADAAGLVVGVRGERRFVPASLAISVVARPVVSRVPGAPIGMTLFAGRVIPVLALGDGRKQLLVCELEGEAVGLSGVDVVQTGFFEPSADGVIFEGRAVPALDVAAEVARAEAQLLERASAGATP